MDIKKADKNEIFLATTALEEFWDTSKPMAFLGEWCRKYSRKSFWEKYDRRVVPNPQYDVNDIKNICNYLSNIYDALLPLISDRLNYIHKTEHGYRYWEIMIGAWLMDYIQIIYDRYSILKSASATFPKYTTILMSEENYIVPNDPSEFMQYVSEDTFNLQLFSRIIDLISTIKHPRRKIINSIIMNKNESGGIKYLIKHLLKYFLNSIVLSSKMKKAPIIVKYSYFTIMAEIQLFIKSKYKIASNKYGPIEFSGMPIDIIKRDKLKVSLDINRDEYIQTLLSLLPHDIPKCYIEGYKILRDHANKYYSFKPKVIFSAIGWYCDESFKHWAAESAEKDTLLVGVQHGGNYGSDGLLKLTEKYEINKVDRYYTWGWKERENSDKTIPFTAVKMAGINKLGASNVPKDILLGVTILERYMYYFHSFNNYNYGKYLAWQMRFYQTLSKNISKNIRIRANQNDYGWGYKQRLKDEIPEIIIENTRKPFYERIKKCRIYVCDYLSTTFAEALALNKPTILFWDPKTYLLNPEAQPYYDELRSAGILYDKPEDAAMALNSIYYDVEEWWNDHYRQKAVDRFCYRLARTSPNAINEWAEELRKIANI